MSTRQQRLFSLVQFGRSITQPTYMHLCQGYDCVFTFTVPCLYGVVFKHSDNLTLRPTLTGDKQAYVGTRYTVSLRK
jgi:hypothetical protein